MNLKAIRYGLAILIVGSGITIVRSERGDQREQVKTRTFEVTYQAIVSTVPSGTRHLGVWLPYPRSDQNQEIWDVEIDAPADAVVYSEPKFQNLILYVSIDDPDGVPQKIQLKFKVQRREYLRRGFTSFGGNPIGPFDPEIERFLKPTRLVPLTEQIRHWAQEVTLGKDTTLERARAIFDYAISILKYDKSGKGWGRGDLLYACDEKRGNCTDFHALFTGFCRAVGIPARFSMGLPLPPHRVKGKFPAITAGLNSI